MTDVATTASQDEQETPQQRSAIVVALPRKDHPVNDVVNGGEDGGPAHMTMAYMGDSATWTPDEMDSVKADLGRFAATQPAYTDKVSGRGTLGDGGADVALMNGDGSQAVRNALTDPEGPTPSVQAKESAGRTFPSWIPHVTLGHPNTPANGDVDFDEIPFDRLALWIDGDDPTEFPLQNVYDEDGDPLEPGEIADGETPYDGGGNQITAAADLADDTSDDSDFVDTPLEVPFHGVAAPIGKPSGDGRMFAEGGVTWRNLPLPMRYLPADWGAHSGAVRVGRITEMAIENNLLTYSGFFSMDVPEVQTVIAGMADGSISGVSVDCSRLVQQAPDIREVEIPDDATPEQLNAALAEAMQPQVMVFSEAEIGGITICDIPAFSDVYIALGPCDCPDEGAPDGSHDEVTEDEGAPAPDEEFASDVPQAKRDRGADNGNAMPDGSFPIDNVEDLKKAIQAAGRAKDIDAAHRHIKKRARALGHPEMIPDGWAISTDADLIAQGWRKIAEFDDDDIDGILAWIDENMSDEAMVEPVVAALTAAAFAPQSFAPGTHDGPGWITNPRATQRIRTYWTHGVGAAKIRWGVPGDFNRCRKQLSKYVQNPDWLAGLCANMHKEALGVWPGMEDGGRARRAALMASGAKPSRPSIALIASGDDDGYVLPPRAWFDDPKFTEPMPFVTIEGDRIFGHIAHWGVCHIGDTTGCTVAPHSSTGYAYFQMGLIETDGGDVPIGHITKGIGHAGLRDSSRMAAAHYDNTNAVFADVAVFEDAFGIAYSGAIRPTATAQDRREMKAAKLSGDWRDFGKEELELVAALAVNVPGFATPRTAIAASAGRQLALVAAGLSEDVNEAVENFGLIDAVADEVLAKLARRDRIATARASALAAARSARIARARKK